MRTRPGLGWSNIKPETIHNLYLSRTIHSTNPSFDVKRYSNGKYRSLSLDYHLPDVHRKLTQYKYHNRLLNQRLKQYQSANDAQKNLLKHYQSVSDALKNLLKQYQSVSDALENLLKQHRRLDQHLEYHLNQYRHLDQHPEQGLSPFIRSDSIREVSSKNNHVMHAWIQFITTPTADTQGTALLLHFDDKRYVVGNIPEGFSRACIQMGIKLTKASDIFITGKTEWQNTGGLMGLVLTMADTAAASATTERTKKNPRANDTKPSVTIHGGVNIAHTLATGRRFIFRKDLPVYVKEYLETDSSCKSEQGWEPDWADSNLQVWAMVIESSSDGKLTTLVESKSPGKRSFDDFSRESSVPIERAKVAEPRGSPPSLQEDICANVVMDMFASSWHKNNLDELPLAEVAMPARLFVRNKYTNQIEKYRGALPGQGPVPDIKVLVQKPWPFQTHLPQTSPSHNAVSYIFRCQRQRGKFLVKNAEALNVPPGKLRRQLVEGLDVQLKDGTIVKPEMVLGKGKEGGGVVVADLPSDLYVHGLLSRPEWKAPEVMTGVEAVIWILGPGVSKSEDLQNFINDHKHLKHIISSPDVCPNYLAFNSSALVTGRLNQLDPLRYPIPIHNNAQSCQGQQIMEKYCGSEIILAERGLKVQLEPSVSIGKEQIVPPMDFREQELELPESVRSLADHARQEILSEPMQTEIKNQHLPSPDAEIICLGTGSSTPSKYRNLSGTLLRVPGAGSYLLDCGENTLGQLRRLYSPTELGDVLRDLKLIWISHLHADHHLGTISVIKAWRKAVYGKSSAAQEPSRNSPIKDTHADAFGSEPRLCIISSKKQLECLKEYSFVENFGFHHLVYICSIKVNEANVRLGLNWSDKFLDFENGDSLLYVNTYMILLSES